MQLAIRLTVIGALALVYHLGGILTMNGQQTKTSIRGQIYSTLGYPLPGATLKAQIGKDNSISTSSDAQGYYEFNNLPEGQITVQVRNAGGGWESRELRKSETGALQYILPSGRKLELKAGQQLTADFILYVFPTHISALPVKIKGVVRESDNSKSPNAPLSNAMVRVTDVFTQMVVLETRTDKMGYYSLLTPPIGSQYIVQASKPGFIAATTTIIARSLAEPAEKTVDLVLTPLI
jgi:hypothetical protein